MFGNPYMDTPWIFGPAVQNAADLRRNINDAGHGFTLNFFQPKTKTIKKASNLMNALNEISV